MQWRQRSGLQIPRGENWPRIMFHAPVRLPWLLIALALGAARWQAAQPDLQDPAFIASYNDSGQGVTIEALLIEPPDERDTYTNLRLEVIALRLPGGLPAGQVSGLALARLDPGGDWRYGDQLRLEGVLETPPENDDFSYREYLARQGVYSMLSYPRSELVRRDRGKRWLAALYEFKQHLLSLVYRFFPEPEASLLSGILLGVETGIPAPVQEAFRRTGTAHVIAISGFNITILAGLFSSIFSRLLGRWRGAVLATISIAIYTLLVGASPAVVRAALMGGLSVFAGQIGRRQEGLNSLAVIAGLMAAWNPSVLWDVGFQLSFAATLGLVLFADRLAGWAQTLVSRWVAAPAAQQIARLAGEYLLFTLAAQVTTLPVMAYHFKEISLLALIANPLILPVQPAVMILGGLALLAGLVFAPAGQLLAYLAWPFALYTIRAVELVGAIPWGVLELGDTTPGWVIIYFAFLGWLAFGGERIKNALAALWRPGLAAAGLAALTVLVWRSALSAPDGRLHLTLLDVSRSGRSGEAILIQTPGGRCVLVNGGPSASALSDALGRRLPPTGRRLDALVVAGNEDEQIEALPRVVERFPPEMVLWAGERRTSFAARSLLETLNRMELAPVEAQAGHILDLGDGAALKVLGVGRRGSVLLLEWRNFRALLPVGMDFDTLDALEQDPTLAGLSALLLAESGYAPLNSAGWIEKLRPEVVLLSVATGDRRGLPDAETLAAVEGYTVLRTDWNGWIELTTNGEQLWVEAAR